MSEKSVNEVLAENLRYWMIQAKLTAQGDLAEKSGVSQRTISNYLNPGNRQESTSGKEPSAKLTELEKIARALHVGVWDLVRPMTPSERLFYKQVEKAYADLMASKAEEAEAAPMIPHMLTYAGPDRRHADKPVLHDRRRADRSQPSGPMLGGNSQLGGLDELPMKKSPKKGPK